MMRVDETQAIVTAGPGVGIPKARRFSFQRGAASAASRLQHDRTRIDTLHPCSVQRKEPPMQPRSVSVLPNRQAPLMKRWVVSVVYPPGTIITGNGPYTAAAKSHVVGEYPFKFLAVLDARSRAKAIAAELIVHGRDGRIQDRSSYGNDPKGRG